MQKHTRKKSSVSKKQKNGANDENSMPMGQPFLSHKRGSIPRKLRGNQSLNAQKGGKNVMGNPSLSTSIQTCSMSINSKLHVLKEESLPSQMKIEPLCDTSAFQFTDDMKQDMKNGDNRALGDISSNIINAQQQNLQSNANSSSSQNVPRLQKQEPFQPMMDNNHTLGDIQEEQFMLDDFDQQVGVQQNQGGTIQTIFSYCASQPVTEVPREPDQMGSLFYQGLSETHFNHHSVDDLMLTCAMESEEALVNTESKNSTVGKPKHQKSLQSLTYQDLLAVGPMELLSRTGKLEMLAPCDRKEIGDPQSISEVIIECTNHMQSTESHFKPSLIKVASNIQTEITDRMRQILVSWLVEVHLKFKLLPETLYITVNLVDRYCQTRKVSRSDFQLLGVTAMLIASKYEEIIVPSIDHFIEMTDDAYTKSQVKHQEWQILHDLEYDITFPTIFRFLERYAKLANCNEVTLNLASYLCELTLLEVKMNRWMPSRIACSAIYLAKKMLKLEQCWTKTMSKHTNYSVKEVRESARNIVILVNVAPGSSIYKPVFNKYSTIKFHRVARIPVQIKEEAQSKMQE